jgi:copper chaperone
MQVQLIEDAMHFHIETMTCGGCARGVTKAIQGVDGGATVTADPPNRRVDVTTTAPRDQIVAALTEAGFAPA